MSAEYAVTSTDSHVPLADLIARATAADGVAPLSEQFVLHLPDNALAVADESGVVGLIAYDGESAEMVVDPDRRRREIATALYAALESTAVPVWAHGNLPAARAVAAAWGFRVVRELLVLARPLAAVESVALPAGYELLDLATSRVVHADTDAQWLRVNNEAFSWHPEQGGWDTERLAAAQQPAWFTPEDVLLLWHGDELAGFHWLKIPLQPAGVTGEVYVIGLADRFRGRGLSRPLLVAGLSHLSSRGCQRVILYVEADNEVAVGVYRNLGFETVESHCLYAPPTA